MSILQQLQEYEQRRLVYSQRHPTLPLSIWNYSAECQYAKAWDDVTKMCRGLVVHDDGHIVSKGFNKFGNIEEGMHTPTDKFEIFLKEDGQYIGCFWYDGEMIVNSRGSFTSKYAIEARRILDEKYPDFKEFGCYYESFGITHCFELIGFEQIVVSYSESDLICTGCFRNDRIGGWKDLPLEGDENLQIPRTVKKYNGLDYTEIKQLNWKNSEGFVVRFSNGDRCKIKFEEYIKLHRAMTNLSTTAIWEALRDNRPISEILNDVPDEFYDKVREYESELNSQFQQMKETYTTIFNNLKSYNFKRENFAFHAKLVKNSSILFAMLDGKDYSQLIWNMIKPKFEKI